MLRRLGSKVAGWVIYRSFIWMSKHVSFTDFQRIWNEAYQAHVEAEWIRMRRIMGKTSSMSIRSPQVELVGGVGVMQSGQQSAPTWPPQGSSAGQGEKPQL